MTRLLRTLLPPILLLVVADTAPTQELIPLPDFTEYQIQQTVHPPARSLLLEYLDLAALSAALTLASYFALVRRSRRGLFLLAVASLAWLGFWREGCVCPIGAIQNVTLAIFDPGYSVPLAVVAFFTLPLVFTLFFGRTFCAAVCPLGAVQELVAIRPVKVPIWLEHTLGLLAYVYLGLAVLLAATGTAFVICRYDPFVGFFRRSGSANMLVFGGCFLVVGLFVGRPYCRFFCPYGAILGLLSRLSKWHVKIPPQECIQCRLCEEMCPYGAIREPTVAQPAEARSRGRRRLAGLILWMPLLVVLGIWLGSLLEVPLSRMHPQVQLWERVRAEDAGNVEGTTDASDAFRETGRSVEDLRRAAIRLRRRFGVAGAWLGAWVGLVVGGKLIHLSVHRRRVDYQPDPVNCVSCGRCFWYCPHEQARWGLIQNATTPARPG